MLLTACSADLLDCAEEEEEEEEEGPPFSAEEEEDVVVRIVVGGFINVLEAEAITPLVLFTTPAPSEVALDVEVALEFTFSPFTSATVG